MIGIIYYIYFLFLGFIYGKYLFNKSIFFQIWIGGVLGNVIAMFGIMIPSFIFGFNIISHLVLIMISLIPLLVIIKKSGLAAFKEKMLNYKKEDEINYKIFFLIIVPIFIIMFAILNNHILVSNNDYLSTGQSTYGDLNMHLGFITSIAEQKVFPPNYAFLSGTKLNYPFFINMLSSSLYLFNTSLRYSVLIPSWAISLLIVMGFYFLGYKITNNKRSSSIATILFFLGGGFGFLYFFDGARMNIGNFTRIFTDFFHTPTNFNEMNIRWANPICDMIIPQRATMGGWLVLLPCLWLLIDACKTNNRKSYIILGLLASTMPMIHTHSFLALGVISFGMFITYFFKQKDKKAFFLNWCIYGITVLLIAFPQLFYWVFSQTRGNKSFLNFHFNWVNRNDPYIWFYIKNWGITALFIIPAFIYANKDNKKIVISSLLLFILAEFILFQPNEYDNNKLFFVVYMIFVIICSDWLIYIYDKLRNVKGRVYLAILIIILGTLSGILTIAREIYSGGKLYLFNNDMIEMSEFIKNNTSPKSVFLTSTTHINPTVTLAGRNIYVGSVIYVHFHGLGDEYNKRNSEVERIYKSDYDTLISFCQKNNIDYIYLGEYEKILEPNADTFSKLNKVAQFGSEELYQVMR